jgi:hypothetical protein
MSQQKKLERVLDLLLSEDQDQASELLHQIIVEKARVIYESIVEEEDDTDHEEDDQLDDADEVGGEPSNISGEIGADMEEIDSDEHNDGEAGGEEAGEGDEESDEEDEGEVEDRVDDLESQLAELRAEFDALMGEEATEPYHDEEDMAAFDAPGDEAEMAVDTDMDFSGEDETVVGEVVARTFENKSNRKLKVAPQAKKTPAGKRADEETQFLNKTADTGQKGTAKLVGTGKNTPHGAEQTQSPYTHAPSKKDYGGTTKNILGSKTTGGEYGKYHGDSAKDDTPSDNVKVDPKKSGVKADTTAKYTGGKAAGEGFSKSPFTKKPA